MCTNPEAEYLFITPFSVSCHLENTISETLTLNYFLFKPILGQINALEG